MLGRAATWESRRWQVEENIMVGQLLITCVLEERDMLAIATECCSDRRWATEQLAFHRSDALHRRSRYKCILLAGDGSMTADDEETKKMLNTSDDAKSARTASLIRDLISPGRIPDDIIGVASVAECIEVDIY